MVVDNLFCIRHAAVADLYGITIENFSKFALVGEVFGYQGEEVVSDVGANMFGKWWIIPEDVISPSVIFSARFHCLIG